MIRLRHTQRLGQLVERHSMLSQPRSIGFPPGDIGFNFFVINNAPLNRIHQKHPSRLKPSFFTDIFRFGRQDTRLRSQHHQVVSCHLIPAGPQPVAIKRCADKLAIRKGHRRWTIPGLHHGGMVFIEASTIQTHVRISHPRLGNEHHHGMRQRAARHDQKFNGVI